MIGGIMLMKRCEEILVRKEMIKMAVESLNSIELLITKVEKEKLYNEQWFLDYLDKINQLSVKY